MSNLSPAALAAREASRSEQGQFGSQARTRPGDLGDPTLTARCGMCAIPLATGVPHRDACPGLVTAHAIETTWSQVSRGDIVLSGAGPYRIVAIEQTGSGVNFTAADIDGTQWARTALPDDDAIVRVAPDEFTRYVHDRPSSDEPGHDPEYEAHLCAEEDQRLFRCRGCGRFEDTCSGEPCLPVIFDRAS